MAEEDKKEQGEEGEKKSGKKTIIIIAIVALVAIGASVGVTLMLLGGDDSAEGEEGAEAAEQVEVKLPAVYMDLKPPFLITLNVNGRQRYMQVHVSVSSREQASLDAVDHHLPLIKSRINSLYSAQNFEEIQTEAGKEALREQSLTLINEVLEAEGESPIENVFFTNFVLQ